jgi:hypothetical protein
MKRLFLLLFFTGCIGFLPLKAQRTIPPKYAQILQNRGEIYFKFLSADRQQIRQLGYFISLDNVASDTVFAYANTQGFVRFLQAGVPYVLLTPPSELLEKQRLLPGNFKNSYGWDYYPSYNEYVSLMDSFQKNYPALCRVVSIGKSVQGRDLLFAHIGHLNDTLHSVPEFMYTSTMHGDETTGYILLLHLIDYLLSNYGVKPEVTALIDSVDIWINPLANPDGTYAGGDASVYGATRFNANHVDLNRNYPDPKDGQHPDGDAWQPETKAFMNFAKAHHFVLSCNMHTGTEVANYPWDTWSVRAADDAWWKEVCRQYADTVHAYAPAGYLTASNNGITNGYDWYSISGGRQDYMNYFQYDREFTLELSDMKMPDPVTMPQFWEDNYRSLLDYIHQVLDGLRGTVTDSISGKPLKAEIFIVNHDLDNSQVYTDSVSGLYFRPVYAGTYDVRYTAAGHRSKIVKNVMVVNGEPTVLNVVLASDSTTGIPQQKISTVIVYPNPASDKIYCTGFSTNSMAFVVDLSGKVILSQKVTKGEALNISKLPRGIYFLKVVSGEKIILRRFIKR